MMLNNDPPYSEEMGRLIISLQKIKEEQTAKTRKVPTELHLGHEFRELTEKVFGKNSISDLDDSFQGTLSGMRLYFPPRKPSKLSIEYLRKVMRDAPCPPTY